jgi:hypothetical protein
MSSQIISKINRGQNIPSKRKRECIHVPNSPEEAFAIDKAAK